MIERARQITRFVQKKDPKLFASVEGGMIKIFRESYIFLKTRLGSDTLFYSVMAPYRVFCLTDNFTESGRPIDMGLEPINDRLNFLDSWARKETFAEETKKMMERRENKKNKKIKNKSEQIAENTHYHLKKYMNENNLRLGD